MATVGLRELRQHASDLLRKVEEGEDVVVTVAGRPSVRMVPATRKQWRTFEEIAEALSGEMDPEWERDRDLIDQSIVDPWERR
ncbi:type II toxin-antitoxin system Phd/YefM family antitoxin [Saccharomonospora iraqiensis]|uniref:type II toxin-antitoxin system Phd/YefM family antitoxin n=1 Tax=Saccharomonospora iraqiensis TaxID=52698 RepID=UPI00022E0B27|nr:type II toxin-antitoxin system prevent-host-death family antitoxin [Saccharomonospora iraqiensis]